jgi:hypothetical protein
MPGLPIWPGNYTRAGPNMAGQVEDLRRADGIFFNRAGREKFAHFVERFVPRDGQVGPEPEVSSVVFEGSNLSDDGIGPVILMTSGFADPTATLVPMSERGAARGSGNAPGSCAAQPARPGRTGRQFRVDRAAGRLGKV